MREFWHGKSSAVNWSRAPAAARAALVQRARLARVMRGLRRFLLERVQPYPIRLVNWFMSK